MVTPKKILGLFILSFLTGQLRPQKLLIDSNAYNKWPQFNYANISNDGNFIYYAIHDPVSEHDSLFIKSTDAKWKGEYLDANSPHITQDSRRLVFQRGDSVFTINLGNARVDYVEGIAGKFQTLPYGRNDDLLLYKLKKDPDQLLIREINGFKQRTFPAPERYWYDPNACAFIFLTKEKTNENLFYHLHYAKLKDSNIVDLWHGPNVTNLVFSADGAQTAFLTECNNGEKAIWYCQLEKQKPVKLLDNNSSGVDSGLKIGNILGINKDNNKVLFTIIDNAQLRLPPPGIDIWNYKDPKLQSQQLCELKATTSSIVYKATVSIPDGSIFRLEHKNELLMDYYHYSLPNNWALLMQLGQGDYVHEWNWNKAARASVYLLSLKDGSKRLIYSNIAPTGYFVLSPDEKYVVFYDANRSSYCSFEVSSGIIRNITGGIHTKWTIPEKDDEPVSKYYPLEIAGFTKDHRYVLINDQFDIYRVDLTGKVTPIELTAGYGYAHHVVFRIANNQDKLSSNDRIILNAFNENNKDHGFYSITLDRSKKPDSLTMQPVKFEILSKARDANAYLISRQDASSAPNILFSSDLKYFNPISNLHPEYNYNWLTSELVTWQLPNGNSCKGILYKPENFDRHKKYPLIMHYYERKSDQLHFFLKPEPSYGDINIPLFVSNGFLVFTPDIHYKIGEPGRSAFNTIVSAATFLAKRSYVDAKKIGLQGLSFGGFETNYIIAHTNRFAAAMSSSGMTDFISIYGSIIGDGSSRQRQYELYRDRMGATLWKIPNLYLENSPVLRANLITTPLLMMANKNDEDVPYQQGIELFTALRRLGKKAWMLQYDGQGHSVSSKAADDLTIRVFQFFNYYLKNSLPPKWMTIGVPAELKGIDNGLELDTSGAKP